jgi:hypothetical protein
MKIRCAGRWVIGSAIIAGALIVQCRAQESQGAATAASVVVSKDNEIVTEVLKMLDAKVSNEVIKAYVEGSSGVWNPRAADIITLKQHGATDEITTALLKRGAEVKSQAVQIAADVAAAKQAANPGARIDPESYEYFAQNYLYPRTLASVNQRLGYYVAPYPYGAYGGIGGIYPMAPYGQYYGPYYNNLSFGYRGPVRNGRLR